ncbi:MAG: ABC transporter permease [Rhodanobacteraceae bacterium]|nr:MAG: ABC transporter permease [Rhodanobacteraceae bacterium]
MNDAAREPLTTPVVYTGAPRVRANLVALGTITRREVHRVMRIWTQTLVPPAITMTLYFVIFGKVIGSRIGTIEGGFSYMQYIVPGLVMMSIINNCYSNITSSFFGSKFGHYVEEMLASPMPSWVVLTGYVAGAVTRGIVVGVIVLGIALSFTSLHLAHPLVAVTTVLLGATIFSLAGFINAMFAKRFDDIAIVPTFVLQPLTYLGGVFYSINMLGSPWREVSKVNPILYMVNAFRYGILGASDVPVWMAYAVMLAFVVALGTVALWLLRRGVGLRS